MKNFIIYVNPVKGFKPEIETQFKIQVENLLELGWKREDIILATNFEWEYMGVKSFVVGDDLYFKPDPRSIKCIAVARLFERNQIFEDNTLYWMHDVDHFQQLPVTEKEITDEMGDCEIGICDYGRRIKYNCGSIFFYKSAGDIFIKMRGVVLKARKYWDTCEEERALMILTTNNLGWAYRSSVGAENSFLSARRTDTESIKKRIKKLHITYNFADYNMTSLWRMCDGKPKTAHFNPFPEQQRRGIKDRLPFFLGDNKLGIPLLNERLLKIFKRHGLEKPADIHQPVQGV